MTRSRKGLRFQTKLMLTLASLTAGVTVVLIVITEAKVRNAWIGQYARFYQNLVASLEESRVNRSKEFRQISEELSAHPFVVASLRGETPGSAQRDEFRDDLRRILSPPSGGGGDPVRPAPGKRVSAPADLFARVGMLATMNLEGEVNLLAPLDPQKGGRGRFRRPDYRQSDTREQLLRLTRSDEPHTLFLLVESPDGRSVIQEMVSAPVRDPDSGEPIGLFLRATSAETEAQRRLEGFQEEFATSIAARTGLYLEGFVHSRSLDEEFAAELGSAIEEQLGAAEDPEESLRFETTLGGEDYYLYVDPVTENSALQPAYQVAAFPLAGLRADLAELRLRGSGIGFGVMLISLGLSWLLARNLSIPLRELTRGTGAIREGNLDHRVEVRSRDELGDLAGSFNEMAEELKQKALYRELLGKVSDESVAQALVSGTLDLELGGELKEVSVLFCDIRGFTALTEPMHPSEVIDMLNEHMTALTRVVRDHYGVVDKFVGDEIMAVFGGLKSYGNDTAHAAECALDMIAERERLNRGREIPIEIGIGIATGDVVAGCMGSTDRLNYTVVGAKVNLAARLCGVAGPGEVVIDAETMAKLEEGASASPIENLELKGFRKAVHAWRLEASAIAAAQPTAGAGKEGTRT